MAAAGARSDSELHGLTPAALSSGVGSETQRPFAVVIITGLMTAVAVTLFVLPFAYRLIVRTPPTPGTDTESEIAGEGSPQ